MDCMAEKDNKSKIRATQEEAKTRPVIGSESTDPRQVELDKELNLKNINEANARLHKGTIAMEEYDKLTGRK